MLCRMGREAARLRRQRRKEAKAEVSEVIRTFIQATNNEEHASDEVIVETRSNADDNALLRSTDKPLDIQGESNSDEEFWLNLPASDSRTDHTWCIPTHANRNFSGRVVKSRTDALRAAKFHDKDVVETNM